MQHLCFFTALLLAALISCCSIIEPFVSADEAVQNQPNRKAAVPTVNRQTVLYGLTSKQAVKLSKKDRFINLKLSDNDLGLWVRDDWTWDMSNAANNVALFDQLELVINHKDKPNEAHFERDVLANARHLAPIVAKSTRHIFTCTLSLQIRKELVQSNPKDDLSKGLTKKELSVLEGIISTLKNTTASMPALSASSVLRPRQSDDYSISMLQTCLNGNEALRFARISGSESSGLVTYVLTRWLGQQDDLHELGKARYTTFFDLLPISSDIQVIPRFNRKVLDKAYEFVPVQSQLSLKREEGGLWRSTLHNVVRMDVTKSKDSSASNPTPFKHPMISMHVAAILAVKDRTSSESKGVQYVFDRAQLVEKSKNMHLHKNVILALQGLSFVPNSYKMVSRRVEKSGFHREEFSVFTTGFDTRGSLAKEGAVCSSRLQDVFPSSIYVDIYELAQQTRGSLYYEGSTAAGAAIRDPFAVRVHNSFVDLEKPELVSAPVFLSTMALMRDMNSAAKKPGHEDIVSETYLPIHFRYQQPLEGNNATHRNVSVYEPQGTSILCWTKNKAPQTFDQLSSAWKNIDTQLAKLPILDDLMRSLGTEKQTQVWLPAGLVHVYDMKLGINSDEPTIVQIPAGLDRDEPFVTKTTLIVTTVGAICVCFFVLLQHLRSPSAAAVAEEESKKKKKR